LKLNYETKNNNEETESVINIQPAFNDQYNRWNICSWDKAAPMNGGKNLSPKRVDKRRRQKKAARKSKRRNSRQNANVNLPDTTTHDSETKNKLTKL